MVSTVAVIGLLKKRLMAIARQPVVDEDLVIMWMGRNYISDDFQPHA